MRTTILAAGLALLLAALPALAGDKPGDKKKEPPETPEQIERAQELKKLLDASNKLESKKALEMLGALKTRSAREILIDYIKKSKNAVWSTYAVDALGWEGNERAVDFLCSKSCAKAKNVLIAEESCRSLAEVGDKRAIPTLIEVIKGKKVVATRAAIRAVVQLDPKAEGLAKLMVKLAKHKSSQVREAVAQAMSHLTDDSVIAPLIKMATRDGNSLVRLESCRSLGIRRAAAARDALMKVAKDDKSMDVRNAAKEALGNIPLTESGE